MDFILNNLGNIMAWLLILIMACIVGLPFYVMWKKGLFRSRF
jgi:hypothetical protein